MFGIKPYVNYLSLTEIVPIIEAYVTSKNPFIETQLSGLDANSKINMLASTPQWTYVQIIDSYLTCQLGRKQYSVLVTQQSILGVNVIPSTFSVGMLFLQKFFEFQLHLRQYEEATIVELIKQSKKLPYSEINNELSRLKDLIRLIQEFELKTDDNANYSGTSEEDEGIDEQLDDMEGLFLAYLNEKPTMGVLVKRYGY